ncbi:MAG: aldehyde dehydrogenase [Porticoccaceae bacterium]|nr:MAG: aldehyde dehydrogenase [Porticoccaceae bacterium]
MERLPDALLLIDGEMRPAASGRTFDNLCPWTGEVVGQAADAGPEDVDAAIAAARRAFDETDWSRDHARRFEILSRYQALLHANREKLMTIARVEAGAALGAACLAHVDGALAALDALMGCFKEVVFEEDRGTIEMYGFKSRRLVVREAMGVAGAITPWNVPLYVNIEKVFCGLLAGCTMVLKPAPDTPYMASFMGQLALEAGIPPGVLNVIPSKDPAMAGEMLVTDPRVDLITFTGSTAVGKRIMEKGSATLKRVFLELGGKSANIILEDTPNFAEVVARGMVVMHAGQGCAMATRMLVPKSRYAEACAVLERAYAAFDANWGDFDNPQHVMGPVISKKQLERVKSYIDLGIQEGARLLHGGRVLERGGGFFIEPTCFVDVTNDMRIAREEIFGPVLCVIPFEDDEDAVRIANDSDYGLAGVVHSGDFQRAMAIARRIRAGAISVNGGVMITGDMPFGGYKQSGIGRAWGREGIEEFLEIKVIAYPER